MNALTLPTEFFAPVLRAALLDLLTEYRHQRAHIEEMARFVAGEVGDVLIHFLRGNGKEARHLPHVNDLFGTKGAIPSLNSTYWDRALAMTDRRDCKGTRDPSPFEDQNQTTRRASRAGIIKVKDIHAYAPFPEDDASSAIRT